MALLLHPSQPPPVAMLSNRGAAETGGMQHNQQVPISAGSLSNESLLRQIGLQPGPQPQLMFPGSLLAHGDAPYPLGSLHLGSQQGDGSSGSDDDGRPGRQKWVQHSEAGILSNVCQHVRLLHGGFSQTAPRQIPIACCLTDPKMKLTSCILVRCRKPQMQGRFSGRLPLKEDERRLAEECRLLAPYLGEFQL